MVPRGGIEPPTPCSSGKRSTVELPRLIIVLYQKTRYFLGDTGLEGLTRLPTLCVALRAGAHFLLIFLHNLCILHLFSMLHWAVRDSNSRPSECKSDVLPAELTALELWYNNIISNE